MRADRRVSLRQRLRRGSDAFEFSALIQGVSTLEEPDAEQTVLEETANGAWQQAEVAPPDSAPDMPTHLDPDFADDLDTETVEIDEIREIRETVEIGEVYAQESVSTLASPMSLDDPAPYPVVSFVESAAESVATLPVATLDEEPTPPRPKEERLREAIGVLSVRMIDQIGRMGTALHARDAERGGFYLAQVNQLLELLNAIDPTGDVARQLQVESAPPANRPWLSTAWTLVELAESPLSGLLPADADDAFVRSLLYSAWGVTFDTVEEELIAEPVLTRP